MIAEAAVRLVDLEGLASLTMRRLGSELQVDPMSLYSYFSTKEDILNEIVDLLFREVAVPPDDPDWEQFSRELFSAFRRVLLAHPNAVPLLVRRSPHSRSALAPIEAALRSLRQAGFDPPTALDGYRALMSFTVGYLLQEVGRLDQSDVSPDSWGTGFYGLSDLTADDTPHLLELAPVALQREPDDQFAIGLTLVLTGLKLRVDAQRPEPASRPCP
ncbi:MAG: TetR/AcrR family transcriptional regulator [Actinomycetota bacterium]|nr:TetR/AcrR family transcriptional regulator [Actinomycetota bacterium]